MVKTGRQSFQQMVRLTDDLRDKLRAASDAAGRSLNAEIVLRLEASFDELPAASDLIAFIDANFADRDWTSFARIELEKAQPDIRRVVDLLDMMGIDAAAGVRGEAFDRTKRTDQ